MREAAVQKREAEVKRKEDKAKKREAEIDEVPRNNYGRRRDLQVREAEIEKKLQAVDERTRTMNLQEDALQRKMTAVRKQEENLRRREADLTVTQQCRSRGDIVTVQVPAWGPNRLRWPPQSEILPGMLM